MTTNSGDAPIRAQDECLHLHKFKEFIFHEEKSSSNDQRNCMTRNNNDTYPIVPEELKAELIMAIWKQLEAKRCPKPFELGILQSLLSELEPECRNTKESDFRRIAPISGHNGETINEVQYDWAKLQKFVANSFEKFLIRLSDNAEEGNLRSYADDGTLCENALCKCDESDDTTMTTPNKQYFSGFIKNKPRKMEDKHVSLERFGEIYGLKSKYSFYGVFDGHSGPMAANYATCQLPYLLAKHMKENQTSSTDDYREALETAFLETDKQFIQKNISSGTTAVCALISETEQLRHLYVAWVGDSRALLVGSEASLQLVKSHKPDSPEERKRIEEAGGSVMYVQGQWRVNGFLNVARSIGDYAVGAVIAEPDFVDVPLTATHDFLVLGTDGLWDYVTEAAIIETIYRILENDEEDVADIPKLLIEMAKEGDSQDNITVVIVFLKKLSAIVEHRKAKGAVMP